MCEKVSGSSVERLLGRGSEQPGGAGGSLGGIGAAFQLVEGSSECAVTPAPIRSPPESTWGHLHSHRLP